MFLGSSWHHTSSALPYCAITWTSRCCPSQLFIFNGFPGQCMHSSFNQILLPLQR